MTFLQQYKFDFSCSNKIPQNEEQTTSKWSEEIKSSPTVMFTALTMKLSFQTLESASLCDSSCRQHASPASCLPKAVTEKSLDKQATHNQCTSSQGTQCGLLSLIGVISTT